MPVCFAVVGQTLYSVVDRKPKVGNPWRLKRLRNLAENPRAAVVVDRYAEDWSQLGYVLVRGRARLLASGPEHAEAVASLREKYPQYRAMELEGRPVIAVAMERVRTWGQLLA